MKTLGIVTSSRADFGYLRPLLKKIDSTEGFDFRLIVSGGHLSEKFGNTVDEIVRSGFEIDTRIAPFDGDDSSAGIARHIGRAVSEFASYFSSSDIDLLVVFGDRYDMYPAALAALPFGLPVAHIMGGEVTEGAIDEALRHSLTKLSHLHFVTTRDHEERVLRMGEESWRVLNSGSLAIDAIKQTSIPTTAELSKHVGISEGTKFGIVTFHPVTLEPGRSEEYLRNLLGAIERHDMDWVVTYPGADPETLKLVELIEGFAEKSSRVHLVRSLGSERYFGLMRHAEVMVGNSSSGINEAPAFRLPVVNIGSRQAGRVKAANIVDCETDTASISKAIYLATSPGFRSSLDEMKNPFGDGRAAEIIVDRLQRLEPREKLILKRFV